MAHFKSCLEGALCCGLGLKRTPMEKAWARFSAEEVARGDVPTADRIAQLGLQGRLDEEHRKTWRVWTGKADSGTAMFVFDVVHDLRVWVDQSIAPDDAEVESVRDKLVYTLTGFTNPYADTASQFSYLALAHRDQGEAKTIVSSDNGLDRKSLGELEHGVEGRFDAAGVFTGRVRAWGKEVGEVTVIPQRPVQQRGAGSVGAFDVAFGAFEGEAKNSTHTPDEVARLQERGDKFGGLAVYRDGLRVLPYGRPENDFFGIEERRQMHAGREFWAKRRMFGAVALSRTGNPHLRDKAGREGIIDNQAAREFRLLVVDLLKTLARRYFGTDSDVRPREIAATQAQFERARKAEEDAKKRRTTTLRSALKKQTSQMEDAIQQAETLIKTLEDDAQRVDVEGSADQLSALRERRSMLALPPKPKKLNPSDEEQYRAYRDRYAHLTAQLEKASALRSERAKAQATISPAVVARTDLARHQTFLTNFTTRWRTGIHKRLDAEKERWTSRAQADNQRYYQLAAPLLADLAEARTDLPTVLAELEAIRERLYQEFAPEYEGYLRALDTLGEGIDLDAAFASAMDEKVSLTERVDQWQDLAQLGITVEIVGHELNETASQVSRNLARLPEEARKTPAFELANQGFRALVHRLEFLSPLRLSGPRTRRLVTGQEIDKYIRSFFEKQIKDRNVTLRATEAFLTFGVTEYPHRILPVFTNLVNNALYWVTHRQHRQVLLDRRGHDVLVADTGPGIDPEDESELFNLFFTRRVGGRGVGLYLSRLALQHGRHSIRLASPNERILPGANFILSFQEVQDVRSGG